MSVRRWWLLCCLLCWPGAALLAAGPVNDLRDWRAEQGARVLDGEWLLEWQEPLAASERVQLPFSWRHGAAPGWGQSGFGQVELTTSLLLPVDTAPLGLHFDGLSSAAAVWINDRLVLLRGQPGDADREMPQPGNGIVPLPQGEPQVQLRIRLSNHLQPVGGVLRPLVLAELASLQLQAGRQQAIGLLLGGAALLLALLPLLIRTAAVRRLAAPLILLLLCGVLYAAARGALPAEYLQLPVLWNYRAGYMLLHLLAPLYGCLLIRLFPREMPMPALQLLWLAGALGALLTLLLPPHLFMRLHDVAVPWLGLCCLLFLYVVTRARQQERSAALAMLLATLALAGQLAGELLPVRPGGAGVVASLAGLQLLALALVLVSRLPARQAVVDTVSALPPADGPAPAGQMARSTLDRPMGEGALQGQRVLLVDADAGARQRDAEQLQAWGCELMQAASAAEAVSICARHEFDLVLLDLQLPRGAALQACRQIREEAGDWAPPILGLTAGPGAPAPAGWQAAGMQALLARPLSPELLASRADRPAEAAAACSQAGAGTLPADHSSNARLQALRSWLGDDLYLRLRPQLVGSLREVQQLLLALEPGDEAGCARLCHRLQGSALNFGLNELAAASQGVRTGAPLEQLLQLLAQQLQELEQGLSTVQPDGDCDTDADQPESPALSQGSQR